MPEARKPNAKQLEAIEMTKGPVLITAGPGTGKTYTLVMRTLNLIRKGVKPEAILVTTFTNKAAGELITRLTDETERLGIPFNVKDMYIGTFHSICGRILRDNVEHTRLRPNFTILDEFNQKHLILRNMEYLRKFPGTQLVVKKRKKDTPLTLENKWADVNEIRKFVNTLEEEMVDVEALKNDEDPNIVAGGELLEEYRKILREGNMVDFAESQTECYRLLKDNKDILDGLGIHYLMIDEYQDTNYVQEQLVLLLGGEEKNICVVGDDDQSLYRFRGATVSNILGFADNFPKEGTCGKAKTCKECEEAGTCKKCTVISLEENYRSNDKIVEFYNRWMEDTEERKKLGFYWKPKKGEPYRHLKNIVPQKEKGKEGRQEKKAEAVIRISGNTEEEWHKNVHDFIQGLVGSGAVEDYNQFAFLFESVKRAKVRALANYLEEHGIQVYSPRSNMFFSRDEVKLAIGCLVMMFPGYREYLEVEGRTSGKGKKGIRGYYRECLEKVRDTEIGRFAEGQDVEGCSYLDLLYRLFGQEPFRSMLNAEVSAAATEIRPARNMSLLTELIERFEFLYGTEKDGDGKAEMFFEEYLRLRFKDGVREYEDDEEYAPKGCVSFLTVHQAKGMEYPIVFVGSLEDNLLTEEEKAAEPKEEPEYNLLWEIEGKGYYHGKSYEPHKMVKFFDLWRRFYTAFSRAQDLLVLTCCEKEGKASPGKPAKPVPSKLFEQPYRGLPSRREDGIKFSKTNKTNLKKTFSYTSDIALYDRCPLLYKFKREMGFKSLRQGNTKETVRGTLVHETIEDIHREAIRREKEKMAGKDVTDGSITEADIRKWFHANHEALRASDEYVELSEMDLGKALNQVLRYARGIEGKWDTLKKAEEDIMLPEGNYIIEGRIDLIQKGAGDTVDIVDFKTSERKPKAGDYRYDIYKRQLQVYAYLVEKQPAKDGDDEKKKVGRMHLHYTAVDEDPLITFDYDEEDVRETMGAFKETAERILAKDFSGPVTLPEFCNKCEFRFYCKK